MQNSIDKEVCFCSSSRSLIYSSLPPIEIEPLAEALDRTAATQSQIDSDLKESERKLTAIER